MIKVSAGTASVMGLKKIRLKQAPTTGYIMLGESCMYDCSYCVQGKNSIGSNHRLSRVTWPGYDLETFLKGLKTGENNGLKRICVQEIKTKRGESGKVFEIIEFIKKQSNLPVSLSSNAINLEDVERLLKLGLDKIGISLDVCSPGKYSEYKGGSFVKRLELIKSAAWMYPGKVSTHIIVGLGESDENILTVINELLKAGVHVAIFAFTPLKGTRLFSHRPPFLVRYRKIQAAHFLLKHNIVCFDELVFDNNDGKGNNERNLIGIKISPDLLKKALYSGEAFETTGCSNCNRPYYNEKPQDVPYNYPRTLEKDEIEKALDLLLTDLSLEGFKGDGKNEEMAPYNR